MKTQAADILINRLDKHPTLKARFEAILDIAENTHGDLISTDKLVLSLSK